MKYLILRVRAKISYTALLKRMTIVELFASTIFKCYHHLQAEGHIPKLSPEQESTDRNLMKFLLQGQVKGFMMNLMMYNIHNFKSNGSDSHTIMAAVRSKIQLKLKEKREVVFIKKFGKEVEVSIDKKKE